MALTPPRLVACGYYRVHLYVVMGLCTLASLAAWGQTAVPFWPPLVAAMLSYVGTMAWLLEKRRAGRFLLGLISMTAICGAYLAMSVPTAAPPAARLLWAVTPATAGLLLGSALAAMFLGHWYLNSPTMQLGPLRRLIGLLAVAVVARGVVCATTLAMELTLVGLLPLDTAILLLLRWTAGLLGVAGLAWMAWQTLKVPNTQSATGILYVAVVGTFTGELASELLSVGTLFPL